MYEYVLSTLEHDEVRRNHQQIDSGQLNAAPLHAGSNTRLCTGPRLIMVVVLPVAVSRSFKSLQHHGKLCEEKWT